jgi:Protein of unknown function (DUF4229)
VTESSPPGDTGQPRLWRAFVVYTASRIGLFVVFGALALAAGVRGVIVLLIALVLSAVASYFLLTRQRATFALALQTRVAVQRQRISARTAAEDEIADRLAGEHEQRAPEVG